ncbi:MAG: MFS transporter [Candidatus Atabeyarchaeum deiterrae]
MGKGKLAVLITLGIIWGVLTYGLDWLFKVPKGSTLPLSQITVLNTDYIQIGLILGWAALVNAIAMLPSGRIADRIGRKPIVIVSFLGLAVSYFAYELIAFYDTFWILILVGTVRMVFAATSWVALLAWVADQSSEKNRGTIMSGLTAALTVANVFAVVVIGAMFDSVGLFNTFTLVAAIQLIAVVPLLFIAGRARPDTKAKDSKPAKVGKLRTWREVIRDRPLLVLSVSGMLATTPGIMIQFIILALLSSSYGLGTVDSAIPLGIMLVFVMIGYVISSQVMDRLKIKRGLLVASLIVTIVPLFFLFLTPYLVFMQSLVALIVFIGLFGLGMGLSTPTYLTLITDLSPTGETGTELSVFQGILNFNYVIANFMSGYLWAVGGLPLTMLGAMIIVFFGLVIVVAGVRRSTLEARGVKGR